jgi:DNA end-binding protein Ku
MKAWFTSSIEFGLVSVPVKAYTATSSHDIKFSEFRESNGEPVGRKYYGKTTDEIFEYSEVVKGIETEDGVLVTVTRDELASIEVDAGKAIEVIQFSPAEQINPLALENAYYLAPADPKKTDGYALLREKMASTDRVGIVRYTTRGKTHMAVLRAQGKMLTLQNLAWADEIRTPDFPALDKPVSLDPKMLDMAQLLVESMYADFDPTAHTDTYTDRLVELVAAKAAGEELAPVEKKASEDVSDLLAALEASIKKSEKAA